MQDVANSDIGLAIVLKGIEDNASTKGTIDVNGGLRKNPKRVQCCSGAHGTEAILSWGIMDIRRS